MKKLVAVAALGAMLAALPLTIAIKRSGISSGSDQALAQTPMPCYKGQVPGACPKPKRGG